jgi:hypothetical protein
MMTDDYTHRYTILALARPDLNPSRHRTPARAAVEYVVMSTTADKATFFAYGGVTKMCGTVFEITAGRAVISVFGITAGRVDVGASISLLSQYPGEAEFLMPPLSCLEVWHPRHPSATRWGRGRWWESSASTAPGRGVTAAPPHRYPQRPRRKRAG